jgi:diacylglycerol kinase
LKPDNKESQKFSFASRVRSFAHAFNGLRHALTQEHNFRIHLGAALVVIAAGIFLGIRTRDWVVLFLAIGLVLVAELFNTAIEMITDFISPGIHPTIGKIKDISAGAVLVATIIAVTVGIFVFLPRLESKFHFLRHIVDIFPQ